MMGPDEFAETYLDPPEELEEHLPDRPIANVRDIQYLYGTLYELSTLGDGPYARYLTPDEASDFMGKPESLIAVRVDLSEDKPRIGDPPVHVTKYTSDLVEPVAHSRYVDSTKGIDHSVTHQSGRDSDPERLARYAAERLTSWPSKGPVSQVAGEHENGWIIQALEELGGHEGVEEDVRKAVESRLGGPRTALLTIQVRLPGDDDYRWPGQVEVFQEAMRARKVEKMAAKGPADDASGPATDLLTGKETQTVGTAGDPLRYFLSKQQETFPGLDADRAWQTHPISEDSAVTIGNAAPFVNALTYSTFGANVYYLPYVHGVPDPDSTLSLYRILRGMTGPDADAHATPVEKAYRQLSEAGQEAPFDLRFYVAAIDWKHNNRWDVLGETLNGSLLHPVELARSHREVLDSSLFLDSDTLHARRNAPFHAMENRTLLDIENDNAAVGLIATGGYFYETMPSRGDDTDAVADDPRIQALVSVLGGEPLAVEDLITRYAERLVTEESNDFPQHIAVSQFAQLTALAKAGLLTAETPRGEPLTAPFRTPDDPTMTDAPSDDGSNAQARREKLEAFLEGSPALADDPERRATFLLGALVGHVGSFQQRSKVSLTVIDQHPVGGLTKTNLKRRTQEVLEKDIVYSREEGYGSTMYAEVVDELRDAVLSSDPSTWTLLIPDLRFYYALGVSYGMNDRPADSTTSEAAAPEATT